MFMQDCAKLAIHSSHLELARVVVRSSRGRVLTHGDDPATYQIPSYSFSVSCMCNRLGGSHVRKEI